MGAEHSQQRAEQNAFQRIMLQAFGLCPAWREAFLLCDVKGFTIPEAAAILGISPSAVVTRLGQARGEMNVSRDGFEASNPL